jgi:protein SCO1/2
MKLARSLPWLIAAAALAGALGLWLGQRWYDGAGPATSDAGTTAALVYPKPRELEDFLLERTDGRPLVLDSWRGQWNLVFIGFTHCPDACPQALAVFRDVEKQWPADAGPQPAMYFVSVDPERDSAKALEDYATYFSPRIVAATGTHDRLEPFARQLGMIYVKTPIDGGDYTVDHSTHVAVVDPDGRMVALFRAPHDAGAIVADMLALQRAAVR